MKEYVPVYFDWLEVTQDLTAEEKGNLIDAVVAYASGKEYEHLLTGGCKIAFRFLKGQVDRNAAISDTRSNARRNKQEEKATNENKPEENKTNDNKPEETETKSPKEINKEKEKDINKKQNKNGEPAKRFTPPTVAEVAEYCKERGNQIDPQYFVDYYATRNWTLTNGKKVCDWRACVRTWEHNNFSNTGQCRKTVVAQMYEQRDYNDEEKRMLEERDRMMDEFMQKGAS